MKRCWFVLCWVGVLGGQAWTVLGSDDRGSGLAITIMPSAGRTGWPLPAEEEARLSPADGARIDRDGEFTVEFANRSAKPIRLWQRKCLSSRGTLSFLVTDENGQAGFMRQRPAPEAEVERYSILTLQPRDKYRWKVEPRGVFWGEREWEGVPEANTGKPVTLTAVFEIRPSEAATGKGVWTGRIISTRIDVAFVDPDLETPQQYLLADCPQQAIAMMQAEPEWIQKPDDKDWTPLHAAASCGAIEVMEWILARDPRTEVRASHDYTPLHMARSPEAVRLLLEHDVDPEAVDVDGRTVLQKMAEEYAECWRYSGRSHECQRTQAIVKLLRDAGAKYGLRSALCLGDIERVRAAVKQDGQVRARLLLPDAVRFGDAEMVKLLIEHGADPKHVESGGLTISYYAIEHPDVLKLLCDAGVDANEEVDFHGNGMGPVESTLLHEAALQGQVASAWVLLACGANVNARNGRGFTPLQVACRDGEAPMVEFLLKNGANTAVSSKEGWTPMALVTAPVNPGDETDIAQRQAAVRALQASGVELDLFGAILCDDVARAAAILRADRRAATVHDPEGEPPLNRAAELDRREIVKLLLDSGCDPDIRSIATEPEFRVWNPLQVAIFWDRPEIVAMLIERGANTKGGGEDGSTPLHGAAGMGRVEVARVLIEHGADVNARDKEGHTPLDAAFDEAKHSDTQEVAALLVSHGGRGKVRE